MYLKRNDLVVIVSGKHASEKKQGRIIRIDDETDQVWIQGVNLRYKHIRRSQKNPRGGRVQKEAPIHVSNVLLVDPKTNQPTRVGFRIDDQGRKTRYSKRSGEPI